MSTFIAAIKMRGLTVTLGSIMHLPVVLGCKAFVIPFSLRQNNRAEKEEEEEESHDLDMGSRWPQSQTTTKRMNGSYYTRGARASKLHDLLSYLHRPNEEGLHVPVGDISKVNGRESVLGRPSPSL